MKCTDCEYNNSCSLQEIAKDITGCEGHSKEKSLIENQIKCCSCKKWTDEDKIFIHKNGKSHLCFDCY